MNILVWKWFLHTLRFSLLISRLRGLEGRDNARIKQLVLNTPGKSTGKLFPRLAGNAQPDGNHSP